MSKITNIYDEIIKVRNLHSDFFNPNISHINDSSLLYNVDIVSKLLLSYANNKKKISIYADSDIDGIMATMIMYNWLKDCDCTTKIICHQRNEGHGVIPKYVTPTDLLIIVDSSSNSYDEIKTIMENKLAKDIIVIDHHEIEVNIEDIPNVYLINPHRKEDNYPNKELSGAMVIFKTLEYIEKYLTLPDTKIITTQDLSDLAAISIVSDVMDVSNMENRYYYCEGLKKVKNKAILLLMRKLDIFAYKVSSKDLAFKFNKAINSLLRLQKMFTIFNLLTSDDEEQINKIISEIDELITLRDNIELDIIKGLEELYSDDYNLVLKNTYENQTIAGNFSGVIASKLVDKHNKNVMIINDNYSGSARSYNNFNLKEYINNSNGANGIGHQGAFGIKINDLENLKSYFIDHPPVFEKSNEFDIEMQIKELNKDLFKEIKNAQFLTGKGYDEIKFKITDIKITDVKETSTGKRYYEIADKTYIRLYDNSEYEISDVIDIYCTLDLSNFFGKEYYNLYCYNSILKKHEIDEEWGF